jgi:hypothetical protein
MAAVTFLLFDFSSLDAYLPSHLGHSGFHLPQPVQQQVAIARLNNLRQRRFRCVPGHSSALLCYSQLLGIAQKAKRAV